MKKTVWSVSRSGSVGIIHNQILSVLDDISEGALDRRGRSIHSDLEKFKQTKKKGFSIDINRRSIITPKIDLNMCSAFLCAHQRDSTCVFSMWRRIIGPKLQLRCLYINERTDRQIGRWKRGIGNKSKEPPAIFRYAKTDLILPFGIE